MHVANHGGEALDFLSKTRLWVDQKSQLGTENIDNDTGHGRTTNLKTDSKKMELNLILMDLEMPVMDGLACTKRVRALQREGRIRCHIPILAVTANTRAEQMDIALKAGMVS